jgi:hypothetical protein
MNGQFDWADWASLEGELTSDPHAVSCGNKVFVFVRGTDKGLWYRMWDGQKEARSEAK